VSWFSVKWNPDRWGTGDIIGGMAATMGTADNRQHGGMAARTEPSPKTTWRGECPKVDERYQAGGYQPITKEMPLRKLLLRNGLNLVGDTGPAPVTPSLSTVFSRSRRQQSDPYYLVVYGDSADFTTAYRSMYSLR
jgi:hypothetical protein